MNLENVRKLLLEGKTPRFRASGNSMSPKIKNGDMVTVSPIFKNLKKGDIVLAKVRGRYYLHYILSAQGKENKRRYAIGNAKGHLNGHCSIDKIYGKVIKINKL